MLFKMSYFGIVRLAMVGVMLAHSSAQTAATPTIVRTSDSGNGTASIVWLPSSGAADYLVSAEPYVFTEPLPGGQLTPGGERKTFLMSVLNCFLTWSLPRNNNILSLSYIFKAWTCGNCGNGVVSVDTARYPGNLSVVLTGAAYDCVSLYANCTPTDARILHSAAFSVKSAFSISALVDIGSFIPGYSWPMNNAAGIGIFDAVRGYYVLYCGMVSWGGNTYRSGNLIYFLCFFCLPLNAVQSSLCRECKVYNNVNSFKAPAGFTDCE